MSHKDGFVDSLKHLVFEEDAEQQKSASAAVPAAAPAMAPPGMVMPSQPAFSPSSVSDSDEVYQRLFAKTDFDASDVGATVQKFLQPLASLPMDANLKFKTAIAQAKAQNGLSEDKILATFDSLKAVLRKEQDAFATKAQQFAAREIDGRQTRINDISAQITQLQQELSQLSTQVVEAQGKAARAQGQFTAAVERRIGEIEQQKAQYSALLK